jgi:hypothetical protein
LEIEERGSFLSFIKNLHQYLRLVKKGVTLILFVDFARVLLYKAKKGCCTNPTICWNICPEATNKSCQIKLNDSISQPAKKPSLCGEEFCFFNANLAIWSCNRQIAEHETNQHTDCAVIAGVLSTKDGFDCGMSWGAEPKETYRLT